MIYSVLASYREELYKQLYKAAGIPSGFGNFSRQCPRGCAYLQLFELKKIRRLKHMLSGIFCPFSVFP